MENRYPIPDPSPPPDRAPGPNDEPPRALRVAVMISLAEELALAALEDMDADPDGMIAARRVQTLATLDSLYGKRRDLGMAVAREREASAPRYTRIDSMPPLHPDDRERLEAEARRQRAHEQARREAELADALERLEARLRAELAAELDADMPLDADPVERAANDNGPDEDAKPEVKCGRSESDDAEATASPADSRDAYRVPRLAPSRGVVEPGVITPSPRPGSGPRRERGGVAPLRPLFTDPHTGRFPRTEGEFDDRE